MRLTFQYKVRSFRKGKRGESVAIFKSMLLTINKEVGMPLQEFDETCPKCSHLFMESILKDSEYEV